MTCQDLDRHITRFVDEESADAERAAVIAHLRQCESCRLRVEAESTAKHVLHAHAAIARTMGVPPPWRPRVFRLGQPMVPARATLLLTCVLAITGLSAWWLRPGPAIPIIDAGDARDAGGVRAVRAVGVISDSFCQQDHTLHMITGPRECTLGCVRAGAEFVLVTENQRYRLRNQQWSELAPFANARVRVEGTMDGDRLVVAQMIAAGDAPDH
jgi:hypothetical protein